MKNERSQNGQNGKTAAPKAGKRNGLRLSRETLRGLNPPDLQDVAGGACHKLSTPNHTKW